jgi:hypothetical protein
MEVQKFPRQGDYDALYIHPIDATASPVLAVGAGADLSLSLLLRRGVSEGATAVGLPVLGWGAGHADSGARTSAAAPLVPPNQHVDLLVEPTAPGVVRVTYTAALQDFRPNDWQVILEQGLSLAYRYDAAAAMALLRAWASFAGIPAATIQALAAALADTAHPAVLDRQVRTLFRTLHAAARSYDQQVDGTADQQAPEAASVAGAEAL